MKKPYAEAAPLHGERDAKPTGPTLGTLRVARISYDHHPIYPGEPGSTLGDMIDAHLAETINGGSMVSEVSLIFETPEQQHQLATLYRDR